MTDSKPVLGAATPDVLASLIRTATRRLVVLAPAVSQDVGRAIAERWRALGPENVTITLDVDAEVYRLGYGDFQALTVLERVGQEVGGLLQRHPGIRIGVVIVDDRVLVYSPVPELVEAGPNRDTNAPNAVLLGAPPALLTAALGVGESGHREQVIGLDKATQMEIAEVENELAANPPQKFDVARRVRVFNAAFQFVELKLTGTNIARRTVRIPNHLLGVVDEATRKQLRTVLTLIPPGHELSGEELEKKRQRREKRHLILIPRYGYVVLRSRKDAFLKDFQVLEGAVEAFQNDLRAKLSAALDERVEELGKALLPRMRQEPPKEWLLSGRPPADDEVLTCLKEDLRQAIGTADDFVRGMGVRVLFKDVTYESLTDADFLEAARKALPDLKQLHEEFDAAAGEKARSTDTLPESTF